MYSGLFFLRLAVGLIFIYHAVPKLQDPKRMAGGLGWSQGQVFGLGIIEFMCSVAILAGVSAKVAAFVLMLVMVGAIYHKIKKWNIPFMAHDKTGWEFDFLLLAATLTIYLR
jgi:uncharacterized membrane protein YphA (DoxX/SURF4 family)